MTMNAAEINRCRRYVQEELDAAWMYDHLAAAERQASRRDALLKLAAAERRHAEHWAERLRAAGVETPTGHPSLRSRWLSLLAHVFGPRSVLPLVVRLEQADASRYDKEPGAEALALEEREHLAVADDLAVGRDGQGAGKASGEDIARREGRHIRDSGGNLRAATFGISDGLASNFSLVMGVAGAEPGNKFILLAGIAGLLAGAFSMAAGEYVSIGVQRDMFENQIAVERRELEENPEEETEELSLIYQSKGLPPEQADLMAKTLMGDQETALDTLSREELGLDPGSLGSPWGAAISSFVSFAVGAAIPVVPFAVTSGAPAFVSSIILACGALFAAGAVTTVFTGRSVLFGGARMALIGSAAAAVTWLVGRALGVAVS